MSSLDTYRVQVPFVDAKTGVLSYEAQRWLRQVATRLGGPNGLGTMSVDAGSFAAMQPFVPDACFPDLMQGMAIPDSFGDVMQIDTTQPTDFFGV